MKKAKYFIGLDVHKEKTTYVVRDRIGNILLEGETATLYSELSERLKSFLGSSIIGFEASTNYVFEKRICLLNSIYDYVSTCKKDF